MREIPIPFSLRNTSDLALQISQRWILGPELCDMWTSSDVLCCTASILHLVAIATDRYVTVKDDEGY